MNVPTQDKYRLPPLNYNPPSDPLDVIYEDAHLLVLNKPAGLLSVPGKEPEVQDSLELRAKADYPDALLVHRLDMDTSGIFIMARNKDVQRNLGLQFERRKTEKTYKALCWGYIQNDTDEIKLPIRCDWEKRPLQMVCEAFGKGAHTKYKVLERQTASHEGADVNLSVVELTPITGRSHQLRIHMAEASHPIVGDCFYAHDEAYAFSPRLCLHAQRLTIHHPDGGARTTFESPTPFL